MPKCFCDAVAILAVTAIYFGLGKFGLSLALVNASTSAVWPPTGFALAALLLWGARLWPAVLIGAFLVNLTTQGSWGTSLGIAAGNTCEALIGAWVVNRFAHGVNAFDKPDSVLKFFAAAIFSTAISATFGLTTLRLGRFVTGNESLPVWITWWLGDLVSAVVIAPFLIIWIRKPLPRPTQTRALEAAALSAILAVIAWFVFVAAHPLASIYQLKYLALPPIVWAAFRFGLHGAIASSFAVSGVAIWGTLRAKAGPAALDANQALLLFQAFTGTATLTSLVLASAMSERREAEARKGAVLNSALDCILTIDHQGKSSNSIPQSKRPLAIRAMKCWAKKWRSCLFLSDIEAAIARVWRIILPRGKGRCLAGESNFRQCAATARNFPSSSESCQSKPKASRSSPAHCAISRNAKKPSKRCAGHWNLTKR